MKENIYMLLRILGQLDIFSPLMKEEEMSPNEYREFVKAAKKKRRKRASKDSKLNLSHVEEESEW